MTTLKITTVSGTEFNDEIDVVVFPTDSAMENLLYSFNEWYPYFKKLTCDESLKSVKFIGSNSGKLIGEIIIY